VTAEDTADRGETATMFEKKVFFTGGGGFIAAHVIPLLLDGGYTVRIFDNMTRGVFPGTYAAGGTLDIVAKDVDLACQLARDVGAPAALGALASDIYKRAQAAGWGQEGFPVVARVLEAMAGIELRAGTGGKE